MSNTMEKPTLDLIGGEIDPMRCDDATFANLRPEFHVEDISTMMPGMEGKGIRVAGLLQLTTFQERADHVTFRSGDGQYSASLTLDQAKNFGILIYEKEGKPLPLQKGGPFRLITPGLGDLCANVKNVTRIEITVGPGQDTRPEVRNC